jgi:hypothetical protein
MEIKLTLTSIAQLEAVTAALEFYKDLEEDRSKDRSPDAGFTAADRARLVAAGQLLKTIRGGK